MTISYSDGVFSVLMRWKGSVYKSVYKQLLVYLVLYYCIRFIYFYAFNKHQQTEFEFLVKTFNGKMNHTFALTFILGFYVSCVVKRWWEQICSVVWPEDLVSFTGFIFNDADYNTRIRKHQIAKYLVLTCCLAFRKISIRVKKRFPTINHVVQAGLMTNAELDLYEKCSEESGRWMMPLEWIVKLLRQRLAENKVAPPVCAAYIGQLNAYRDKMRLLFIYDWISIPLVYTQVAAIATYSHFALTLISRQYLIKDRSIPGHEVDMYFPIFTVLEFLFYVGWFKVGQELMKPWGEDDDDAELNFILDTRQTHQSSCNVAFCMADVIGNQDCPPPMEDKFWKDPSAPLMHTKQSMKIIDHRPKSYVSLPANLDASLLEMTEVPLVNGNHNPLNNGDSARTSTTELNYESDTNPNAVSFNTGSRLSIPALLSKTKRDLHHF